MTMIRKSLIQVSALTMAWALAWPVAAAEGPPFPRRNPIVLAVQKTRDGVVSVRAPRAGRGLAGTGVIVDEHGYVITNAHVVGASGAVKIRMADGTDTDGHIVATDTALDLAIVRIQSGRRHKALKLAPVHDLMVGETVIAIGHPFGFTNTVSTGIISALNRSITMPSGNVVSGLIQTDASINPGNSGGPLLNINGELIGINVALREGARGIAFAINADTVCTFLRRHLSALKIAGIRHGLNFRDVALSKEDPHQSVVVVVTAASVMKAGDQIVAVGACPVANTFDVERALWDSKPGQTVAVKVVRQGREMTVSLLLAPTDGAGTPAGSRPGVAGRPAAPSASGLAEKR
jgi:serine protease Do